MSGNTYWNLATDPDKSRGLRNSEWLGHVRQSFLEPGQETGYVWFLGMLDWKEFFYDLHFPNSPNISPLDSTELL
jgi:hypothetical protein